MFLKKENEPADEAPIKLPEEFPEDDDDELEDDEDEDEEEEEDYSSRFINHR